MILKCAICGELYDDQFITKYSHDKQTINTITTSKINVCEYCEFDNAEISDNEEFKIIELEGIQYFYQI